MRSSLFGICIRHLKKISQLWYAATMCVFGMRKFSSTEETISTQYFIQRLGAVRWNCATVLLLNPGRLMDTQLIFFCTKGTA